MAGKHTFVNSLEQNAKVIPGSAALVQGTRLLTYKDLDNRANQLAHAFLKLGVQRSDRVAIALTNCAEFLECTYGLWKCANISVPLNYRFQDEEWIYVVDNSDCVGIVVEQQFLPLLLRIKDCLPKLKFCLVLGDEPGNTTSQIYNYTEFVGQQPEQKPTLIWAEQSDNDIGYNIYTGGTTGMPKGISYNEKAMLKTGLEAGASSIPRALKNMADGDEAPLTFVPGGGFFNTETGRNILRSSRTAKIATWLVERLPVSYNKTLPKKISGNAKALVVSPLMHSVGWGVAHGLTRMGGTVFLLSGEHYDPKEALGLIQQNKINFLAAIGDATLKPIVQELEKGQITSAGNKVEYDITSLKTIGAVGMPTSPEVKEVLLKQFLTDGTFVDVIGGSEMTGMGITVYTAKDTEFNKASFPTSERMKIINSETGVPVKPGEIGELARRTSILPNGYYKDQEKTEKLIRHFNGETWLMSGDLALLDDKDFFHFVGRGSECINTGGEKVYPEEVENILSKMDGVKIVGLTATPDDRLGELVTAIIELEDNVELSEDHVMEYTKGKISGYKRPRRVIFTDEFPRTLVGKPHYKALREMAKQKTVSALEPEKQSG